MRLVVYLVCRLAVRVVGVLFGLFSGIWSWPGFLVVGFLHFAAGVLWLEIWRWGC